MKIPMVFKIYLTVVVLLTGYVGSTIFLEPIPKKQEWVIESYRHCWWKDSLAWEKPNGYWVEVYRWDKICTWRNYYKPKEETWQ